MPEAKVVSHPNQLVQATVGQPGAKVVQMPTVASHSSPMGARVVQNGAIPGRAVAQAGGSGGAAAIAPGTSVAQVIQRPPQTSQAPRAGVARRPQNTRMGSPAVSRVIATPATTPEPAAPLTQIAPMTIEQCLFMHHLVDGFFLAQKEATSPVNADVQRIATETAAALQVWMVALTDGSARPPTADETTPAAASSDAPPTTKAE